MTMVDTSVKPEEIGENNQDNETSGTVAAVATRDFVTVYKKLTN